MTIFEQLADYFQSIADSLEDEKEASRIFTNKGDMGSSREDILKAFLANHLPKRCEVIKGGFIFNKEGERSKQIDLIVTNDLTLQFKHFDNPAKPGKSFNCVEGCYCAISVKTKLDKGDIIDSLENLASIPAMPEVKVNPMLEPGPMKEWPYRIVFAYDGVSYSTAIEHINYYYKQKQVKDERKVNLVIVNNNYCVVFIDEQGGKLRDGTLLPPRQYYPMNIKSKYLGGYILLFIITEIQRRANIGPHMLMDFRYYLDRIPL